MEETTYLDYAATTPVDPRVLQAMLPYFIYSFGNPSSSHQYGRKAENAVETAREVVSSILNCKPNEIVFTSCGSESDNLALRGAAAGMREKTGATTILTSQAEHHAVSRTAMQMVKFMGYKVGWLPVDEFGRINPELIKENIDQSVAIVSVMLANNEIGTINPIPAIAKVCQAAGTLLHTDAVQAAAYLPIDVDELGVDLLSLGAHKFYGPKGVGVLYIRQGTSFVSFQTGGGQEFGFRAGTHNVPYIVGFAEALRLTNEERNLRIEKVKPLRDLIINNVLENIQEVKLTGHPEERLPNHCSFVFKGVDGNLLLNLLDNAGFACSSGSACKTGNPEPSEVMNMLKLTPVWGLGSLRVTLGMNTTQSQVEGFLTQLPDLVKKARNLG